MKTFESNPQGYLRLAGLAYLANIALGLFGEVVVRGTMVVAGDGLATAARIAQDPGLWRLGLGGDLLMQLLDIPLIVVFYLLLRPVSRPLALMATAFNIVQTAVLAANKLFMLAPLLLITAPATPDLGSQVQFWVRLHAHGFGIGLIFFGVACLLRGWLIARSGVLPRALGVLLIAAGAGYLVNSFALLLAPTLAGLLSPRLLIPSSARDLALSLWLLARGLDVQAWHARWAPRAGP